MSFSFCVHASRSRPLQAAASSAALSPKACGEIGSVATSRRFIDGPLCSCCCLRLSPACNRASQSSVCFSDSSAFSLAISSLCLLTWSRRNSSRAWTSLTTFSVPSRFSRAARTKDECRAADLWICAVHCIRKTFAACSTPELVSCKVCSSTRILALSALISSSSSRLSEEGETTKSDEGS